jgi:hypothetical protein
MTEPHRAPHLPHIHPAAWHGAVGEAVRKVAPTTEADPAAVLVSLLALFGALAGDTAYTRVGGVRHPARIWPLLVGKTGSGRKGTSWAAARHVAVGWGPSVHGYLNHRVVSGLASGEGLIAALGGTTGTTAEGQDPVAPDGKLTVVETEFARVLAAAKRDGSTLGPILRQLWDDGSASILTRAAPLTVNNAHLGVVAHVTPRELRLRLAESDLAGGTMNRFLLIASERPHLLPYEPEHQSVQEQADWLTKALETARFQTGEVRRDRRAEALWEDVYRALSADEPDGPLGSVLARGPAYTMRLALVYALADGASSIGTDHLIAALAVWQYAVATARLVFPEAQAVRDLQRLYDLLARAAESGVTRTEITQAFKQNRRAGELAELVAVLIDRGIATEETERPIGPGRPATRYRATGKALDPMAELLRLQG